MIKRRFVIKCSSKDVCVELLNKITEEISIRWMKTEIRGSSLIIEAVGMPYELKSLRYEIENLKGGIEIKRYKGGEYSIQDLFKAAKSTVPIDALTAALKLKGYQVEREGERLISNAPAEEVLSLINKMNEIYQNDEIRFKFPHGAKKIAMILHAIYDLTPEEIITLLKDEGVIVEGEFKYELKEEWQRALKKLVKSLSATVGWG